MEVLEKIVKRFKPLAIPAKAASWMFDSVLNTHLVKLQICKLGLKTRIYDYYIRTCTHFEQVIIHNI